MTDTASLKLPMTWVVCLCADWCGLCRDYRTVLESITLRHPGLRFAWLDIEDQSELVGDLDIATFPTLLIANEQGVQFMGPLTPHAETLSRLLTSLQEPGTQRTRHEPVTHRLLQVLPALPDLWIIS